MIIYIDGMDFRRTGIGRVMENLLAGFAESDNVSAVQVVVPRSKSKEFVEVFGDRSRIEVQYADFEPFTPGDFFHKQQMIDRFPRKADIHYYPNMNVPLDPKGKVVFTIHDIIMMTSDSGWGMAKKVLFRLLTGKALSRAQGVAFVSDFTRREVERAFGKVNGTFRVIHNCVADDFLNSMPEEHRSRPIVSGDYILSVGIRVRHKNHAGLIRGWWEARKEFPNLKLAIVGKRLWEDDVDRLRRAYGVGDELVEVLGASDAEMMNFYANAKVFVLSSFVEGFGIPILEAMAMGVPAICSDIRVFREVNGDAVRYVKPDDPHDIGKGIVDVLTDSALRDHLVTKGKKRAILFTRTRMVEEYLSFFRSVTGGEGGT